VVILQGNHDYLREGHSYFDFLNFMPGVRFITKMQESVIDDGPLTYFLPHCKNPAERWKGLDFSHYDLLFMHQTVSGAVASNGQKMDGEKLPALNAVKVYSGDIHVPQVIGSVEYIGSPYHVHFGDRFEPRCILLDRRGQAHNLKFETISRVALTVKSLRELKAVRGLKTGDHIKLKVELDEAEKHDWLRIKREASAFLAQKQVEVFGVELAVKHSGSRLEAIASRAALPDSEEVARFVLREGLTGDALAAGLDVLG
jgi:hypothetical protein